VKTRKLPCITIVLLLCSTIALLRVSTAHSATVDVAIKAVIGYPLIDTLPNASTPVHVVWFGVGLLNEGTTDVYCDVTIYLNSMPKFYIFSFFLPANTFKVAVTSADNSVNVGKGTHVLSAYVAIAGDTHPADNYLTGDTIKVGRIADVNCDGKVDIRDVSAVSARMGMGPCSLNPIWIPEVDVIRDNKIDIKDISYYAARSDYYNMTRCLISYGSTGVHGTTLEWSWACDLYRDGIIDNKDISIAQKHYGEHDP
jgi:hypothetical protein